jgi:hypothetical protein
MYLHFLLILFKFNCRQLLEDVFYSICVSKLQTQTSFTVNFSANEMSNEFNKLKHDQYLEPRSSQNVTICYMIRIFWPKS